MEVHGGECLQGKAKLNKCIVFTDTSIQLA
jgi:hypothetical protein